MKYYYCHLSNIGFNEIEIDKNGIIKHSTGGAGFASILLSTFFKPKRIFLVGFDGPEKDVMKHYDGKNLKLKKSKIKTAKKMFSLILKYIIKQKIQIISPSNDKFWGLKKAL